MRCIACLSWKQFILGGLPCYLWQAACGFLQNPHSVCRIQFSIHDNMLGEVSQTQLKGA
ncbi:hypothetical protein Patl1_13962 [Pistacia atlantica]|uniref:Uncharacterized protein n=1 Tax=Pistacia atlantica TaxID=434234 RepID=A0ACC1AV06_9ROSI|nr:hypothetical protein Patl1_13962 [Pistacia atlantica]